jgi:hypothetical protein
MDQYKSTDQSRRVATLILAGGVFARPMVGPAGIPAVGSNFSATHLWVQSKIPSSKLKLKEVITN